MQASSIRRVGKEEVPVDSFRIRGQDAPSRSRDVAASVWGMAEAYAQEFG